jgi:hypothetical protein
MVIQALPQNGPKGLLMANNDILDMFYNLNERLLTFFFCAQEDKSIQPKDNQVCRTICMWSSQHFLKRRHNGPKGLLMANNDILDVLQFE